EPAVQALLAAEPRATVVAAARDALARVRTGALAAPDDWGALVARIATERATPSLRPVLNATGVVVHTNLGRAPLAPEAVAAVTALAGGYGSLEFDLDAGARGSRNDHGRVLLARLCGAEDALAVNNAAGALVLALNAAAEGRDVLISRGELVEIGGSFRIPDILARSGARLREVGTTNRTRVADYADALDERTGAILTVHRSNFELRGFVASPEPAELAALARARGVPYLHDIGSGLLTDLAPWGLTGEPLVRDAVATGADAVLFSGDKLLGGPQAGLLVGQTAFLARCRTNPLARALRADKLTLAALAATLRLHEDPADAVRRIPVLRMLTLDAATLAARAEALRAAAPAALSPALVPGQSTPGGGSFPTATLATTLLALDPGAPGADALARRLRLGDPPLVARVADGRVLLDPRTLPEDAAPLVGALLTRALEG
ncbi:MAG: L-seryl-tRNA(Sec) selenium transferase, partial [Gemmatimonadales bacterium]|nr:L-seryl-tRNA(Sec) selenium transferase [Gemmatimonadales bacterium]